MHLVISTHFSFFWLVCHPSRTFPQKSLNGNPGFPFLPITRPYLILPLTHGSPPLYWLGVSGWCLSLVLALLPYESMACLVFMRLPLLAGLFGPTVHSAARFNSFVAWMSHWVFILCISFLLWAGYCLGMGLLFFNLALVSFYFLFVGHLVFLPRHYIASAMILFNLCLMGLIWACPASSMYYFPP